MEENMKKVLVLFALIFSVLLVFADDDENACEYARKAKNPKVWQHYLKKFPNGSCSFEAESEIAQTEEASDNAEPAEKTEEQPSTEPEKRTESAPVPIQELDQHSNEPEENAEPEPAPAPEQAEAQPSEQPADNAKPVAEGPQKKRKHRINPYRPWGTATALVGALAVGATVYTSYLAIFYDQENEYEAWSGYTAASVALGVLGGGLLATGIALVCIKRPENKNVTLNNLSVAPTKGGMFASAGFSF